MEKVTSTLAETLLGLIVHPVSRMFWPFLITAFVIAFIVAMRNRDAVLRDDQRLFSRATWLSRSAMNDYGLILGNALIFAFVLQALLPDVPSNIASLSATLSAFMPRFGDATQWWAPLLLSATLFVVDDFVRYVTHYCEHRVPALWELHKVHHSADVMNFATAERHHPLSLLFFQFCTFPVIIAVNACFLALFGDQISALAVMGGNIFWVATNVIGGALRHSPVWVSFGSRVERWLISPAQHQIHHSDDPRHFDCNFGGSLAIWDRMFGTLYITTAKRENIHYGLGVETSQYSSLFALFTRPILAISARLTTRTQVAA